MPRWLKENFLVKAGMLSLAILLWFLVVTEKIFEDAFPVPIFATGIPKGKTTAFDLPKEALVRFHGRAKELLRLRYVNHPHVNLDLNGVTPGKVIKLMPESVVIPGGMNVTAIEILKPDSIMTAMDDYTELAVPVKLDMDVKYSPGYTLYGDPEITPGTALISGPHKSVLKIEEILTELIQLTDLSRTTEVNVRLKPPSEKNVRMTQDQTTVAFRVERIGERELTDVEVNVKSPPKEGLVYLEPNTAKVTVSGAVSLLASLEPEQIKAWVNCEEFNPNELGWLPLHVDTPKGTELTGTTPTKLRVTIRK